MNLHRTVKEIQSKIDELEMFPNLKTLSEVSQAIHDWDREVNFSLSNNLERAFRSFYLLPKNLRTDAYQLEILELRQ